MMSVVDVLRGVAFVIGLMNFSLGAMLGLVAINRESFDRRARVLSAASVASTILAGVFFTAALS